MSQGVAVVRQIPGFEVVTAEEIIEINKLGNEQNPEEVVDTLIVEDELE